MVVQDPQQGDLVNSLRERMRAGAKAAGIPEQPAPQQNPTVLAIRDRMRSGKVEARTPDRGPVGFGEGFSTEDTGRPSTIWDLIGGSATALDAWDWGSMLSAAGAIDDDTATQEQRDRVKRWGEWESREKTRMGKVGSVLGGSIPFAMEILAGGFGLEALGAKLAAKGTAVAALRGALAKLAKKGVAGALAKKGLEGAAIGVITEIATGAGRTRAGAYQRMYASMAPEITEDEAGELDVVFTATARSFMDVLPAAALDALIEPISEKSGEALMAGLGKLLPFDRIKSAMTATFGSWMRKNPKGSVSDFRKALAKVGWDGIAGEMLEERYGDALRAGASFALPEDFGGVEEIWPGIDQIATEAISFGIMGGALKGVEMAVTKRKAGPETEQGSPTSPASGDVSEVAPEAPGGAATEPPAQEAPVSPEAPESAPTAPEAERPSEAAKPVDVDGEATQEADPSLDRIAQAEGRSEQRSEYLRVEPEAQDPEQKLAVLRAGQRGLEVDVVQGMRSAGVFVEPGRIAINATASPLEIMEHEAVHSLVAGSGGTTDGAWLDLYRTIRKFDAQGLRKARKAHRTAWVAASGLSEEEGRAAYLKANPRGVMKEEGFATRAQEVFGYMELLRRPEAQRRIRRLLRGDRSMGEKLLDYIRSFVNAISNAELRSSLQRRADEVSAALASLGQEEADFSEVSAQVAALLVEAHAKAGQSSGEVDPRFQTAYHGSGADFEKFSDDKIGTGEGAQAYGYGHYFADELAVAKSYSPRDHEYEEKLLSAYSRAEKAGNYDSMEVYEQAMLHDLEFELRERFTEPVYAEALDDVAQLQKKHPAKIFKVDLAPSQDEYLLWDKPLSEQSEKVKAALEKIDGGVWEQWEDISGENPPLEALEDYTGGELVRGLQRVFEEQQAVSEMLLAAGIRGTKYLDGTSRSKGKGSFNYVIFDPADVKIEARFAPGGQSPPYFSAIERAVEKLSQKKFSAQQLRNVLKKAEGVTEDEMKWVHLDELLQGRKTVTKDETLEWLRANTVEVRETVLGDSVPMTPDEVALRRRLYADDAAQMYGVTQVDADTFAVLDSRGSELSTHPTREAATAELRSIVETEADHIAPTSRPIDAPPRHATYQLPGGENYREVLLTLPSASAQGMEKVDAWARAEGHDPDSMSILVLERLHAPQEIRDAFAYGMFPGSRHPGAPAEFTGGHYGDIPNVLAHIRMNERVDADGGKMLFIEEIQSDLHQEGRKKGYGKPEVDLFWDRQGNTEVAEYRTGNANSRWRIEALPNGRFLLTSPGQIRDLFDTNAAAREAAAKQVADHYAPATVPEAPFKQSWPSLALKRAIKWAADNGFDSVGWTVGEQQFDRWGSEEVAWVREGDHWRVSASEQVGGHAGGVDMEGEARARGILQEEHGTEVRTKEELLAVVARVLTREDSARPEKVADRVWERMQTEDAGSSLPRKEGMEYFYDKILVNAANKLGKRFGVKAGVGEIRTSSAGEQWEAVDQRGVVQAVAGDRAWVEEQSRPEWTLRRQRQDTAPVHTFPLTGDMRATAQSQGFSTFAPRFAPAPWSAEELEEPNTALEVTETLGLNELSKWDEWRTRVQDAARPIEIWEKKLTKLGGTIVASLRDAISLYPGKQQARSEEIKRVYTRIEDIARKHKFWGMGQKRAQAMLGDVVAARDAVDRNPFLLQTQGVEGGSGLTDKEANDILDAHMDKPGVREIAEAVVELNHETRLQMLSSGMISQERFDFWEENFPNYAPQRTVEADPDAGGYQGPARKGFQVARNVVEPMKGRRTRADNPLVFSFKQAESMNMAAEKARVGRVAWDIVSNPTNQKIESFEVLTPPEDPSQWEPKEAFGVWVDGEYKVIRVSSSQFNRAMKALGHEHVGGLLAAHGQLVRMMSRLITSWNPNFMVPNFFRDLGTAGVNISTSRQKGIRRKVFKSLAQSMRAIASMEFKGKAANTDIGRFYAEVFVPGGGLIGWAKDRPFEEVQRDMLKSWKRGPVKRTLAGLVDTIEKLNSVVEMGVRVASAYQLVQAGVPVDKAIRAARELTVDFNRRGEWTSIMSSYKMFINARIQGAAQMLINVHDRPAIAVMGTGIAAAAFGHSLLNFFAMGDDDDGESRWFKKPEWERDTNMMFLNPLAEDPHEMFKVPLAYGYNVFWVLGDRMAEAMIRINEHGEDRSEVLTRAAGRVAVAAWNGFSPVSDASWLQMASPTGLTPLVQISENKAWHGGPIMPAGNPFDKAPEPDSEKAWPSAAPLSKEVARLLNSWTGGNKYRSGAISVSPETFEHVYESYLGGLAKMGENAYKLWSKPWADTGWNKVPVLRRFYSDDTVYADRELYYTAVEEVWRASREVEGMEDPPARARRLAPLLGQAKASAKQIKKLRDRQKASVDPASVRLLEEQMRRAYMRFGRAYNRRRWQ